jgi:hypothetical protein
MLDRTSVAEIRAAFTSAVGDWHSERLEPLHGLGSLMAVKVGRNLHVLLEDGTRLIGLKAVRHRARRAFRGQGLTVVSAGLDPRGRPTVAFLDLARRMVVVPAAEWQVVDPPYIEFVDEFDDGEFCDDPDCDDCI